MIEGRGVRHVDAVWTRAAITLRPVRATPSIDVLVVSFNTRELLRECLDSLRTHAAGHPAAEVTISVYDNASTDGSADLVADSYPEVRLVRGTTNAGFAAANNELLRTSACDHVLLLNSDTRLTGDLVEPLLGALRAQPDAVAAGPRLIYPDGRPQASSECFPTLAYDVCRAIERTKLHVLLGRVADIDGLLRRTRQIDRLGERDTRETEFLWATCWLIPLAVLGGEPLFAAPFVTYDEDLDFCRRMHRAGRRVLYVPSVELVHHGGGSSSSAHKRRLTRAGRRTYYAVHHGRARAWAYHLLSGLAEALKAPRRRRAAWR